MTKYEEELIGGFLRRWVPPENHKGALDELVYGIIRGHDRRVTDIFRNYFIARMNKKHSRWWWKYYIRLKVFFRNL